MNKKVAVLGLFMALAFVLSYIEMLLPINIGIPGVKLGLGNIVVIVILEKIGIREAFLIGLTRVIFMGLIFTGLSSVLYGLVGTILSLLVMILLRRINRFSIIGISVAGSVMHNLGQIIVAEYIIHNSKVFYYFPVLLISGTIAGIIIGAFSGMVIIRIKNVKIE